MIKRIIAMLLVIITAACLTGCGGAPEENAETKPTQQAQTEYGSDSYEALAEAALELVRTGDAQGVKKLLPESEIEYNVARFNEKEQDYFALLNEEFEKAAQKYAEDCGEDWQISFEFTDVREKDPQQYRDYDGYYFKEYGIDPDKITEAVFIYADVTVTGSKNTITKQKSCWTFCYEGRWYSLYIPSFGLYVTGK